jgi:hypothetical protein
MSRRPITDPDELVSLNAALLAGLRLYLRQFQKG